MSWAVVLAAPPDLDSDFHGARVLCAGPLPGLLQSSFRAELFALIAVAEIALSTDGCFRVWTDCAAVVTGFQLFVHAGVRLKPCHAHFDLWERLLDLLAVVGSGRIQVGKVPSHENLVDATSALEHWAFVGNHAADAAARSANEARGRGRDFWDFWKLHAAEVDRMTQRADMVRDFMLAVSKKWQAHDVGVKVKKPSIRRPLRQFEVVWNGPDHVVDVGGLFARRFASIKEEFVRWWNEGIDSSAPVVWVAFAQLYVDWQLRGRHPGFVVLDGKWWDPKLHLGATPENISWRKRSRWFRLSVQQFFRDAGIGTKTVSCKPCSSMIQGFVGCVSLPWSAARLREVDAFLRDRLQRPILGLGQDLDLLPPAW